jgi:alkaline phosphatase
MTHPSTRRQFLKDGVLILTAAAGACRFGLAAASAAEDNRPEPALRLGLLTDCHYADRDPAGRRIYRESLSKVREAVDRFNEAGATLAFELGDFIDAAPDIEQEIGFLKAIEKEYARFRGQRHYVLGNHCVHTLTKQEFIDHCGMKAAHGSFDHGDFHFIVLDACYRQDGVPYGRKNFEWTDSNIPPAELEWLDADLRAANKPTLVFVHQRLDVEGNYGVRNAAVVRKVLEESGRVLAVFQGHNHVNDHKLIGGVHYCTLTAVVEGRGQENNAYALVDLYADGSLRIDGFRKQKDYEWNGRS